jgi:hypothetical protein
MRLTDGLLCLPLVVVRGTASDLGDTWAVEGSADILRGEDGAAAVQDLLRFAQFEPWLALESSHKCIWRRGVRIG